MIVFIGGNTPTFAHQPSSFRPRSGVILKFPFLLGRFRMTLERGTWSERQERKTERREIPYRSAFLRHRSVLVSRTMRVVPTSFLSFPRKRPFFVPLRSEMKRPCNERYFRFWVVPSEKLCHVSCAKTTPEWQQNDTGMTTEWHRNDIRMTSSDYYGMTPQWCKNDCYSMSGSVTPLPLPNFIHVRPF